MNQTFVRRFLRGGNPLGQTIRTHPEPDYPAAVYQIVGVIPDTKYNDIRDETPPMVFCSVRPISQSTALDANDDSLNAASGRAR